ncbi:gamma-glutamyl phosphate reductase [Lasius niger]|uniref:glutamate-5-semialdehyde dehydrogenase n=1 Tax=Lasius niger TaxID=67767 RepID=A0A0J7K4K3_LASNI|nr:gamma-glutamyl phosphate reductase [Lasius niger]
MGKAAKEASWQLASLSSEAKNKVLLAIADSLEENAETILSANAQDMEDAEKNGLTEALKDRLRLNPERLSGIANDVRQVCNLADPVGEVIDGQNLDSGLKIERRRVPLGVVGVIYEARPNVTVDVASLCLKTGNAVILRGGKETHRTNAATVSVIQKALKENNLPEASVQAIDNPDRKLVAELLRLDKYVDMLIPRGGAGLHKLCREQSTIPALAHIRHYGTQHSDAILTQSIRNADRFVLEVDSAAVYVNASTRFSDGAQFGLGAEVARPPPMLQRDIKIGIVGNVNMGDTAFFTHF